MSATPLVETVDLEKHFPLTRSATEFFGGHARRVIHAVDGVTLTIMPGETLGLIGESGSGKTTLGWEVARLHDPTGGSLRFEGQDLLTLKGENLRHWRHNVQVVFQDPVGSLDPRLKVWQIVGEPLRAQNQADRWFARNEPKRIRREHRMATQKERERLTREFHAAVNPSAAERERLTREYRKGVKERSKLALAERERLDREYRKGAKERAKLAPAERERLDREHQKAVTERAKLALADRQRRLVEYQAALKRASQLPLPPPAERQRLKDEYQAALKRSLPAPVIPRIPVPPRITRETVRKRVQETLPTVGLPVDCLDQYPHEFSGGGRQRLSLARALIVDPKLLILDEPTSALDVAVQAQILNRLVELQRDRGFAYLLITHNVAAVRYVADRVAVMYLGRVVEIGSVRGVLERPIHPYTKALLAAVPVADASRRRTRFRIGGDVPSLVDPPPGCRFAPRCPFVIDRCRVEYPALREIAGVPGQLVSCHRAEEVIDIAPASLLVTEPAAPPPPATAAASS
jgi:oligopeptide/dipeptide ABC transporter ATP-binding protein